MTSRVEAHRDDRQRAIAGVLRRPVLRIGAERPHERPADHVSVADQHVVGIAIGRRDEPLPPRERPSRVALRHFPRGQAGEHLRVVAARRALVQRAVPRRRQLQVRRHVVRGLRRAQELAGDEMRHLDRQQREARTDEPCLFVPLRVEAVARAVIRDGRVAVVNPVPHEVEVVDAATLHEVDRLAPGVVAGGGLCPRRTGGAHERETKQQRLLQSTPPRSG